MSKYLQCGEDKKKNLTELREEIISIRESMDKCIDEVNGFSKEIKELDNEVSDLQRELLYCTSLNSSDLPRLRKKALITELCLSVIFLSILLMPEAAYNLVINNNLSWLGSVIIWANIGGLIINPTRYFDKKNDVLHKNEVIFSLSKKKDEIVVKNKQLDVVKGTYKALASSLNLANLQVSKLEENVYEHQPVKEDIIVDQREQEIEPDTAAKQYSIGRNETNK